MSKLKKWFAVGALALSLGTVVAPTVSAKTVVHQYNYDWNRFTGSLSNYHAFRYRNIPDSQNYTHTSQKVIFHGWNFIRYEATNNYR